MSKPTSFTQIQDLSAALASLVTNGSPSVGGYPLRSLALERLCLAPRAYRHC